MTGVSDATHIHVSGKGKNHKDKTPTLRAEREKVPEWLNLSLVCQTFSAEFASFRVGNFEMNFDI